MSAAAAAAAAAANIADYLHVRSQTTPEDVIDSTFSYIGSDGRSRHLTVVDLKSVLSELVILRAKVATAEAAKEVAVERTGRGRPEVW